jgi:hypothetical protein
MRRYGLRDDQWARVKDLLPGREGSVTAADNRLFVEAVLLSDASERRAAGQCPDSQPNHRVIDDLRPARPCHPPSGITWRAADGR